MLVMSTELVELNVPFNVSFVMRFCYVPTANKAMRLNSVIMRTFLFILFDVETFDEIQKNRFDKVNLHAKQKRPFLHFKWIN